MLRRISAVLLVVYVLFFIDLTLFQFYDSHPNTDLVPFKSIARDARVNARGFVVNFLGNLGVFLPVGALAPLVWPGRVSALRVVVAAAALSGAIEAAQYASGRRTCDIDDVTLNATGALLGYGAFRAVRTAVVRRSRSD